MTRRGIWAGLLGALGLGASGDAVASDQPSVPPNPVRPPRVVEDSGIIRYFARPSAAPEEKVARYIWDRFASSMYTPIWELIRFPGDKPLWEITLQDSENTLLPWTITINESQQREYSRTTDSRYTLPLADEADRNLHTTGCPPKFDDQHHLHVAPYHRNPERFLVVGFLVNKGILTERDWLLRLQAFCEQRSKDGDAAIVYPALPPV